MYDTKDGQVVICVGTPKQYDGLIKVIGYDKNDSRIQEFLTNEQRVKNRVKFDDFLNGELHRFTS